VTQTIRCAVCNHEKVFHEDGAEEDFSCAVYGCPCERFAADLVLAPVSDAGTKADTDATEAALRHRVAQLEAGLAIVRAALAGRREHALAVATDWLNGGIEPTTCLDVFLHGAWHDGREGKPHPLADAPHESSRELARRSGR
jgi:hypothetical protein